jgi:excisionase family DNA binding protein
MTQYEFDDPILTVGEVSTYLKISKSKIYYLIKRKQIPFVRMGKRSVRIIYSDLLQWIDDLRCKPKLPGD